MPSKPGASFDAVAAEYDAVRPGYPAALFEDLITLLDLPSTARLLEIGCGTGQATLPLAVQGYQMLCVELGAQLAAIAQQKLRAFPEVRFHVGPFEQWPVEQAAFDLIFSATAFHWLDPVIAYPRCAAALKPGGSLALIWNDHVQIAADQGFFAATQPLYLRNVPDTPPELKPQFAADLPSTLPALDQSGLFGPVTVRHYHWQAEYNTATYLRLINTYSNHRMLDPTARERLFSGIAQLIDNEFGGRITKGYVASLFLAEKKETI